MKDRKKIIIASCALLIIIIGVVSAKLYTEDKNQKEIDEYIAKQTPTIPPGYDEEKMVGLLGEPATFSNVINDAELIIEGEVTEETDVYYDDDKFGPYHDAIIKVSKVIKGNNVAIGDQVAVKVFGGVLENSIAWSPDDATFKQGEKVLIMLSKYGGEKYKVSFGVFGKILIQGNKVQGISMDDGYIDTKLSDIENRIRSEVTRKK